MNKLLATALFATTLSATSLVANAADYVIDTKGAHASINFKVNHMGFSYVTGRFNTFDGSFSWDAKDVAASKITVNIDAASVDSNHAKRDKHIRSDDFIDSAKFATATFQSTKVVDKGDNKLAISGDLTLHGVTKSIVIDAVKIGEGKDPWGGYRVGFSGTTKISMSDFGFKKNFGDVEFDLVIEGIRK